MSSQQPSGTGAQSIEPAALEGRKLWANLVRERLILPPKVIRYGGLDYLDFSKPITKGEARKIQLQIYGGSDIPNSSKPFCGKVSFLASASKMNAWGWNLPAGPESLGGACPGSVPGFPMLRVTDKQREAMLVPEAPRIHPETFLCSGCYAIKGRYASALLQVVLAARYQFARWCLEQPDGPKVFARFLVPAIANNMARSVRRLQELRRERKMKDAWKVQHPAFFRLHDSGDFFSHEYAQGWFEVAREFTVPRFVRSRMGDVTIPAVTFWAPTRIWCVRKALKQGACPQALDMSCAPPNFVLRPSSLHFKEVAPRLSAPGYAAGTASGDTESWSSLAAWTCPAYLSPEEGGGAEPDPRAKGKWVKGCCSRSRGPGYSRGVRTDDRAPRGHGCRACWTNPELSVVYQEH